MPDGVIEAPEEEGGPPEGEPVRRAAQLVLGLFLAALGIVCTLRSGLGVSPWDVLHGGLAERLHLSFGLVVQGVGAKVDIGLLNGDRGAIPAEQMSWAKIGRAHV